MQNHSEQKYKAKAAAESFWVCSLRLRRPSQVHFPVVILMCFTWTLTHSSVYNSVLSAGEVASSFMRRRSDAHKQHFLGACFYFCMLLFSREEKQMSDFWLVHLFCFSFASNEISAACFMIFFFFFSRLPGNIGRSVRSLRTTSWNWWDSHKWSNYRRRPFWKWTRITKQPYNAAIFCMFLVWSSLPPCLNSSGGLKPHSSSNVLGCRLQGRSAAGAWGGVAELQWKGEPSRRSHYRGEQSAGECGEGDEGLAASSQRGEETDRPEEEGDGAVEKVGGRAHHAADRGEKSVHTGTHP